MKFVIWHKFEVRLKPGKYTENIVLQEESFFSLFKISRKVNLWGSFKRWLKNKFTLSFYIEINSSESINQITSFLNRIKKEH